MTAIVVLGSPNSPEGELLPMAKNAWLLLPIIT